MQPAHIAVLLAAALAAAAHAQPIWRCGDSYSQQPCAGGSQVTAPAAPAPSDRAQSSAATSRDARLADSLEKQRLQREAQAQATPSSSYVPPNGPDTALDAYKTPEKKATRKLDVFTASVPGSGKASTPKGDAKAKKPSGAAGKASPVAIAAPNAAPPGQKSPAKGKAAKPGAKKA